MATTRKSRAGARKAPAKPKTVAKAAPVAAAAPAASPGNVLLVTTAKGTRTFHDGRGRRITVGFAETFEVDAATARILLRTDPEAFAKAGTVPDPEPASSSSSGAITVEDLGPGGVIAKPKAEASAASAEGTSSADASSADASSGGDDQGGMATPADDPDATASGEAGTPPSGEDAAAPGATVLT